MHHIYLPVIDKPNTTSPNWYKDFHHTFYISQLVNTLLIRYLDSFIMHVTLPDFAEAYPNKKITQKKLKEIDISIRLQEIVDSLVTRPHVVNHLLSCSGVNAGEYFNKDICINLEELRQFAGPYSWPEIVAGIINIWEFIFLFSTAERIIKNILDDTTIATDNLITRLINLDKELPSRMNKNHKLSWDLMEKTWDLYTYIRNIYSHTHGIVSPKNLEEIKKRIGLFRKAFNKSLHKTRSLSDAIIDTITPEAQTFFNTTHISPGHFIFLQDKELNFFRNFIAKLFEQLNNDHIAAASSPTSPSST